MEIEDSQKAAVGLILDIDKKNEDILLKMFKRFQKFFDYYFKKIVPNGDTSMKLIRYSEGKRSKKKQEYKGIDLRVTFAGSQQMDIEKENDDPQRPDRDESHGSLIKMKHFSRG